MNSTPSSKPDYRRELFDFVLDKSANELPAKRVRILRALAEYAGDPETATTIKRLAKEIESAEASFTELSLQFRPPSTSNGNNPFSLV